MGDIVVAGAVMCGLAAGMLLAGDGHTVTIVERDPQGPPADAEAAWDSWPRRGVPQFRQLYFLLPRFRQLVEAELPRVADALEPVALRHHPVADVSRHVATLTTSWWSSPRAGRSWRQW